MAPTAHVYHNTNLGNAANGFADLDAFKAAYPFALRADAIAFEGRGSLEPFGARAFGIERWGLRASSQGDNARKAAAASVVKRAAGAPTKKQQVFEMLQQGIVNPASIMAKFDCTNAAAVALIGDVKRMGHVVTKLTDGTFKLGA